jgi:hypothetical protein
MRAIAMHATEKYEVLSSNYEHAQRQVQAQRWRRSSPQNVVRLIFGHMQRWICRRRIAGQESRYRKIKWCHARTVAAGNPMAGRMDTIMRCRGRRTAFDRIAIAGSRQVVRVIVRMVAGTGRLGPRRNHEPMIATTEHAVREHVQSSQNGDDGFHDLLSLSQVAFLKPTQKRAGNAVPIDAVHVVFRLPRGRKCIGRRQMP